MDARRWMLVALLMMGMGTAWAHEEHGTGGEQKLTGEVVDA